MKKTIFKRIFSFVSQVFFWLPFSILINLTAIGPLWYLSQSLDETQSGMPLTNLIFIWPALWAIAFGLNKLRQKIKGRKTDEFYDVAYDEVTTYYFGDTTIESHRMVEGIESWPTIWGWIGILLSFVAFPLQLIAVLASFIGLFVPVVYTTTVKLPEDEEFSFWNQLLHSLFDFIIIPCRFERRGVSSAKGLLYALYFILIAVGMIVFGGLIGAGLEAFFFESFSNTTVAVIAFLLFMFMLLVIVACVIKYGILIVCSCTKEEMKSYCIRFAIIGAVAALLLIISVCFS